MLTSFTTVGEGAVDKSIVDSQPSAGSTCIGCESDCNFMTLHLLSVA